PHSIRLAYKQQTESIRHIKSRVDNLYSHKIFPSNRVPRLRHLVSIFLITPAPMSYVGHRHIYIDAELIASEQAANRSHLRKVKECPTFSRQQRRFFSAPGNKSLPFYPNES